MKGQNKSDESRLLPIWALAAANLSDRDHTIEKRNTSRKKKNTETKSYLQGSNATGDVGSNDATLSLRPLELKSPTNSGSANSPPTSAPLPAPTYYSTLRSSPPRREGGSLNWVKNGNKWTVSDRAKSDSLTYNPASKMNPTSYLIQHQDKSHPTAVSSFAAMNPIEIPKFSAAATVLESVASSSSGLYSRRQMAITQYGFPYMPALHLTRNASKLTFLSKDAKNSSNQGLPRSAGYDGRNRWDGQGNGIKRTDNKSEDDLRSSFTLFDNNSGLDSEGYNAERVKEWKEQFVEKYVSNSIPSTALSNSPLVQKQGSFQSLRARSADSDYDSEVRATVMRLKEWKEEQYRLSKPTNRNQKNSDKTRSRKEVPPIQMSLSYPDPGYDSDSSRKQRLREWKEQQFAQISSMVDHNRANDANESSLNLRKGKSVPGGGLFPATSPSRKSKLDDQPPISPYISPSRSTKTQLENIDNRVKLPSLKNLKSITLKNASSPDRTRVSRFRNVFKPIGRDDFSIEYQQHVLRSKQNRDLPSWDNCLYVKVEGARSGTIFLTQTHLIFIYDDEVTDELLSKYGWHRNQIADLLLDVNNVSNSRGTTPVNVPLDQLGDCEAVELIESKSRIVFSDLLEDGLRQKSKRSVVPTNGSSPICTQSSELSSSTPVANSTRRRSSVRRRGSEFAEKVSTGVEQETESDSYRSNEDAISGKFLLRAIHEESESQDKDQFHYDPSSGLVFGSDDIHNNFTNLSSFTELDIDMYQDEETILYITGDADLKQKYVGIQWKLSGLSEIFERRYMMKEVAIEIFAPSSSSVTTKNLSSDLSRGDLSEMDVPLGPLSKTSIYLAIPDIDDLNISPLNRRAISRRDHFIDILKQKVIQINDVHVRSLFTNAYKSWNWGRNPRNKALELLTRAWQEGHVSNYNYLIRLNAIAGRSFHDLGQYPIMPWVLSNYTSSSIPDLSDPVNFRDLSKPMGAQCPVRFEKFQEKYTGLCNSYYETAIPPFMYGSHYSNIGGVVLHYLVRLRPFAGLHRQLQGGKFDIPDRLFRSVNQTWDHSSKTSLTEVKELTPEWYDDPQFLMNTQNFNFGYIASDGERVGNVILPPWSNDDPSKFIEVMQNALESDYCSEMLPHWIDLIFGYKQRGPEAEKNKNVFYHLSYYDSDDVANIEDDDLRTQVALHIADFGSCPNQLFFQAHPHKKMNPKGEFEMMMGSSNKKTTHEI